jgi:hypothetical protein
MSLETLKLEAAALDEPGRRELMAFLVSLRERQWASHLRSASASLSDKDPGRWLTLEELKERVESIAKPEDE